PPTPFPTGEGGASGTRQSGCERTVSRSWHLSPCRGDAQLRWSFVGREVLRRPGEGSVRPREVPLAPQLHYHRASWSVAPGPRRDRGGSHSNSAVQHRAEPSEG